MIAKVLLSVVLSATAVALFSKLVKSLGGAFAAAVIAMVSAVLAFWVWLPLVLQLAASFIIAVLCMFDQPRKATACGLFVGAMVVGYAFGIYWTAPELIHLASLQHEFPIESLDGRLAYENRPELVRVASPPQLSPDVESRLAILEPRGDTNRALQLRELHDRFRGDFVMATGFGPPRMIEIYREAIALDDLGPVALPQPGEPDSAGSVAAGAGENVRPQLPRQPLLTEMHDAGVKDLFAPNRFGYVQDKEHVAGFQSHRFTKLPEPADDPTLRWTLVRLELIGLLKYDRPKAYVSENLPRLDELGEAATREIDDFEASALERLQTEEDLVVDEGPERIRMLGSLRAGKQCLECHSVQRGQLLGALSYEIVPRDQEEIIAARD